MNSTAFRVSLATSVLALASVAGSVWLGVRLMGTRAQLSEVRAAVERCQAGERGRDDGTASKP